MGLEHAKLQSSTRLLKSGQEEGHVIRADDKRALLHPYDLDNCSYTSTHNKFLFIHFIMFFSMAHLLNLIQMSMFNMVNIIGLWWADKHIYILQPCKTTVQVHFCVIYSLGKGRCCHCGSCCPPPSPCDWSQNYFWGTSEREPVWTERWVSYKLPNQMYRMGSYTELNQFLIWVVTVSSTWLLGKDFFSGEMELRPDIPPPTPRRYSRTPCVPPQPPYPPGLQEVDVGVEGLW